MRIVLISLALFLTAPMASADECGTCSYEAYKVQKYEKRLEKIEKRLAKCRFEAETKISKTCFYEVKYTAYITGKVTKWSNRLAKCKDWHEQEHTKG